MLLIANFNATLLSSPCACSCACIAVGMPPPQTGTGTNVAALAVPLLSIARQIASELGYAQMLEEVYVTSVLLALTPQYPPAVAVASAAPATTTTPAAGEKAVTTTVSSTVLGKSFSPQAQPVGLVDLMQDQNLLGASTVVVNCWQLLPAPTLPTPTTALAPAALINDANKGEMKVARLKNLNRLAEEVLAAAGVNPTYEVAIIPPGNRMKFQNSSGSKGCAVCTTASDGLPLGVQMLPQSQPSISETAFSIFLGHAISHYLQAEDEDEDVWTALHIVSSLSPLILEEWD
jgi:hypothetical protein